MFAYERVNGTFDNGVAFLLLYISFNFVPVSIRLFIYLKVFGTKTLVIVNLV